MKRYIVVFDRKNCTGAGSCVTVDPDHWRFAAELNKSELLGSKKEFKDKVVVRETLEIPESELAAIKEAAMTCPAKAIQIKEKTTGKQII